MVPLALMTWYNNVSFQKIKKKHDFLGLNPLQKELMNKNIFSCFLLTFTQAN